ncbi:MAG: hypothetical protein QF755_06615 [Candidatus Peribacteraceae bacterium]|jgi:hypothetical protein|nr:hypothetical protein [Candidatus Peribacteraceae bacterium]HCI03452.1 hypothetical protein [Candidatus Peribacteria bacterium]|tara:strand:- start:278 stop:535 length:258 start_codon:yes stop_codon:yes gene_type:complete
MPAESPGDGEQKETPSEREQRIIGAVRREWKAALDSNKVFACDAFLWHHIVVSVRDAYSDVEAEDVYRIIHQIDDGKLPLEDEKG